MRTLRRKQNYLKCWRGFGRRFSISLIVIADADMLSVVSADWPEISRNLSARQKKAQSEFSPSLSGRSEAIHLYVCESRRSFLFMSCMWRISITHYTVLIIVLVQILVLATQHCRTPSFDPEVCMCVWCRREYVIMPTCV